MSRGKKSVSKKNQMAEYMKSILSKTKLNENKMVVGGGATGKYIAPPVLPVIKENFKPEKHAFKQISN